MSKSDVWKKRPCVVRYREFKDKVRELGITIEPGDGIQFHIACKDSWSATKRMKHHGKPHLATPDLDNLVGGLFDACLKDDRHVWCLGPVAKFWTNGQSHIIITR